MDYLEGLFLGKLWSDTDFENRRHAGLFILYGILVDLIVLYSFITDTTIMGIGSMGLVQQIILITLFIACPFICFRYYRMPLWGKILVLLEKAFKAVLVISLTVTLALPRIPVGRDGLQDYFVDYLNKTLEKYTMQFQASSGSFSTVIGVLAGGIHIVLVFVLILALSVLIPGLIFMAVRIVQYLYDWLINRLIIRKLFNRKQR